MKSINEVTILGHLGQQPTTRKTSARIPVCNFSVATHDSVIKGTEKQERTTWHSVIAWNALAERNEQRAYFFFLRA
jgi:single-strand DNA-binding protein